MNALSPLQIRVLGCSGGLVAGQHTTAFLIDHRILVDAGTGVSALTLDEMRQIDHVFITHSHMDHILCLPLLLDSAGSLRETPMKVHALPQTIHALQQHVFNNHIWPDFSVLPSPEHPFVEFCPLETGEVLDMGGCLVEALPASHNVPTVGYAVRRAEGAASWVFTGDTGPNPALWERLNQIKVGLLFIEAAFSDDEAELARISGHLSPAVLCRELMALGDAPNFPICITHTKPTDAERITEQLNKALSDRVDLRWLGTGDVLNMAP